MSLEYSQDVQSEVVEEAEVLGLVGEVCFDLGLDLGVDGGFVCVCHFDQDFPGTWLLG